MSVASQPPVEEAVRVEGRERRVPGDIHMWVMVLGEFFVFGAYLIVYMIDRATSSHAAYAAKVGQAVDRLVDQRWLTRADGEKIKRDAVAPGTGSNR